MVTTVRYDAARRSLAVTGVCQDDDTELVRDALQAFSPRPGVMVMDLTEVTRMTERFARWLVGAHAKAAQRGQSSRLHAPAETEAAKSLAQAQAESGLPEVPKAREAPS